MSDVTSSELFESREPSSEPPTASEPLIVSVHRVMTITETFQPPACCPRCQRGFTEPDSLTFRYVVEEQTTGHLPNSLSLVSRYGPQGAFGELLVGISCSACGFVLVEPRYATVPSSTGTEQAPGPRGALSMDIDDELDLDGAEVTEVSAMVGG